MFNRVNSVELTRNKIIEIKIGSEGELNRLTDFNIYFSEVSVGLIKVAV